jgi:hypothetical protein
MKPNSEEYVSTVNIRDILKLLFLGKDGGHPAAVFTLNKT